MEGDVERVYAEVLAMVEQLVGSAVTNTDVLNTAGDHLFGKAYRGTFPKDAIPQLTKKRPYAIANLDPMGKPGSHWTALAFNVATGATNYYDSFGRSNASTLGYGGEVVDNDTDAEQTVDESNCGARALAYLLMVDFFGYEAAARI